MITNRMISSCLHAFRLHLPDVVSDFGNATSLLLYSIVLLHSGSASIRLYYYLIKIGIYYPVAVQAPIAEGYLSSLRLARDH
jgi:hypothetical protein